MLAIETINLSRVFINKKTKKRVEALKNISLQIQSGQIFGLLGRNGAGKTTLIRILTTLLLPTSGSAYVLGYNVENEYYKIRPYINLVSGGENPGYGILNVKENLFFFSQLYGVPRKLAKEKIEKYIKEFGLEDRAYHLVNTLSTGEKQRMQLIRGLLNDPEILFLDEPTVGLDVESARFIRQFIKKWVEETGKTVILTTHYLAEAEELCNLIAIIDLGKIMALDTPSGLKAMGSNEILYEIETTPFPLESLRTIKGVSIIQDKYLDGKISFKISLEKESLISNIINKISEYNSNIIYLRKKEISLEDAFINIVGRPIEDES
ncbi:MAG: ABC transporter ATP-binding protein [Dictyoglomaceae bacterium]|nr:ABC transporter ATP-binding protein [Dictyoglomaceae bacterium]